MDRRIILLYNIRIVDFVLFPQKRDIYMCVSNADRVFLAADDVKGSMHIIIIDKQFWLSAEKAARRGAFLTCKIVIEWYLRCQYGHKKVIIKMLWAS